MKREFGKKGLWGRKSLRAWGFVVLVSAALMLPGTGLSVSAAGKAAVVQGQQKEVVPITLAAAALQESAVYELPEETSAVIGTALSGQALNICGQTADGWYETVFGNGIGYIRSGAVAEIAIDESMTAALAQQAQFVKALAGQPQVTEGQPSSQSQDVEGQPSYPAAGNLIFVGDSRTGQMGNAVGGSQEWPGTAFVACFGGGVEWLSGQKAKQDIDSFVTPGSVVILNYGVNDLARHNDYIPLINRYAADWREKGAVVYFASVGPVGENEYGKRNWAVEYFNGQLSGRLDRSIGRIDLYGYLAASGYATMPDGLHYTPDTYARMFQFLCQSVGR
ncbi:MAG: hypothetical protein UIQ90_06160 [Eisenbergiella sp.]